MPPFRPPVSTELAQWPLKLLGAVIVVGILHVGREVLAPLALALLLTVASVPVAAALERFGLPRVAAVLVVLLGFVLAVSSLAYMVLSQALALAQELPRYEDVLRAKVAALGEGSGAVSRLVEFIARLGNAGATPDAPMPVAVAEGPLGGVGRLLAGARMLLPPLATLAITLLLMTFILVRREDVRDRALRLAGVDALHRSTRALTDATDRLSRFLLMQLLCNATFGLGMGVGLWAMGMPNAALWGVLGFALRFIPFVGAPISALFPLLLAFALSDGWTLAVLVFLLFAMVDILVTYVMEPLVYGHSTGTSPLALLLSSLFWVLVWGPIGLILAPALTACLVVLARHVPALAGLEVLLGDKEPLPAEDRFYQRLLAEDAAGGAHVLAEAGERDGVAAVVETLVMPAVQRLSGIASSEDYGPVMQRRGARTLVRALELAAEPEADEGADVRVLAAGGALDRAAALATAAALREQGWGTSTTRGPALVHVLVVAGAVPPQRLKRQWAMVRRAGGTALLLSASHDAEAALREARLPRGHASVGELAEALQEALDPEPVPA